VNDLERLDVECDSLNSNLEYNTVCNRSQSDEDQTLNHCKDLRLYPDKVRSTDFTYSRIWDIQEWH
jgi:hypothetical protein